MRIGRLVGYLVGGKNLATNSCLLKKSWCNNIYYAQSTNKIKLQSGKGEMEGTAAPTENKTIDQTGMNEEKIEAAEGNPTPVSKPR